MVALTPLLLRTPGRSAPWTAKIVVPHCLSFQSGDSRYPRLNHHTITTAPSRTTPGVSATLTLVRALQQGASSPLAAWLVTRRLIHGFALLRLSRSPPTLPNAALRWRPVFGYPVQVRSTGAGLSPAGVPTLRAARVRCPGTALMRRVATRRKPVRPGFRISPAKAASRRRTPKPLQDEALLRHCHPRDGEPTDGP
jgi:hypothetical protein